MTKQYWRLGALFMLLYVLISSGTTGSGDAMVRYSMAHTFLTTGDLALEKMSGPCVIGKDGKIYAAYGIGQAVIFSAGEGATRLACAAVGGNFASPVWEDVSVGLTSVFVLPFISVVCLILFCKLLRELGVPERAALATTLLVGLGSPFLPYAKFHQEENQVAALIVACAYFAVRAARGGRTRDGAIAAALCWLPMWFRPTAISMSVPLALLTLAVLVRMPRARSRAVVFATLASSAAVTAAWLLFYNWYRFGNVFETGYQQMYRDNGFDQGSVAQGLLGPFFHPSKSILIYSPLLVLSAVGARYAWGNRDARRLLFAGLAILALSVVVPSHYKMWGGDTSWGPRYQIASHFLLLVFVGFAVARWRDFAPAPRAAMTAVAACAVAVQLVAIPFNFNLEYNEGLLHTWDYETIGSWYVPESLQIPMRVESLARSAGNWVRPPSAAPADAVAEYSVPDFLPWKLGKKFGPKAWGLTVALWAAGLLAWIGLLWAFVSKYVRAAPDGASSESSVDATGTGAEPGSTPAAPGQSRAG